MIPYQKLTDYLTYFPQRSLSKEQKNAVREFINDEQYQYENCNCFNCSGTHYKVLFKNDRYGIPQNTVLCLDCGFVYSNPHLSKASTEKFYKNGHYRRIYGGENPEKWFKTTSEISLESSNIDFLNKYDACHFFPFIMKYAKGCESICEIGAGAGWNLLPFKRKGKKITGFEPDYNLVKYGNKFDLNLKQGFINDVNEQFDLVILKHVIEHLQDPINEMWKLRSVVDNYLYVEVPGVETMLPSIQNAHLSYFSVHTLQSVLAQAGFICIKINYYKNNNFIIALFQKEEGPFQYQYPNRKEIDKVRKLYRVFNFKKFIKLIKTQ